MMPIKGWGNSDGMHLGRGWCPFKNLTLSRALEDRLPGPIFLHNEQEDEKTIVTSLSRQKQDIEIMLREHEGTCKTLCN